MGVIVTYYLVEDKLIDRIRKDDFDLCDYFYKNELQEHTYNGVEFEKNRLLFGADTKCWHPMYELLKMLDKSDAKIFDLTCSQKNEIEDTSKHPRLNYIYSSDVIKMWNEIKKISVAEIESHTENKTTIEFISNIEGYWTNRITNTDQIIMEFVELFKSLWSAKKIKRGIILEFG